MGHLKIEKMPGGVALVSLCREPVNTLDLTMWRELKDSLTQLEKDSSIRGVIYCSGLQRDVFTAGNDLMELYAPKTSFERCAGLDEQFDSSR
jgi:Delta3-Delta2-enoyl-CoA isomerase